MISIADSSGRAKMEDKHALLKDLKDIGRRLGYSLDHLPSPTGM